MFQDLNKNIYKLYTCIYKIINSKKEVCTNILIQNKYKMY